MSRSVTQHIICWSLLLYLAAFMIPPLSAFYQTSIADVGSQYVDGLVKDNQQTTLYLYDLLIWKSLKKSRHTASQDLSAPEKTVIDNLDNNLPIIASTPCLPPLKHSKPEWYNLLLQHSRSADIHFIRSGISPPSL